MATVSPGRTAGGRIPLDWLTDWLISFVSDQDNWAGLAVIAASAMLEYVFPPFPGDTITLFAAVLITAYDWSFVGVFGAVMLGSVAGSMADFWLGTHLERRRRRREDAGEHKERRKTIQDLIERFRRHGAWYLVLNRFFPGIRALFFVAAGMIGMKTWHVLLFSAISAAVWNLAIIGVGSLLGANFETLELWARRYAMAFWLLLGAIALGYVAVRLWRRYRSD
jgi:membrane protein DedA with SNARE-associated domain